MRFLPAKVIPVILSGGAGTRLWPVSSEVRPKPFLKLDDGHSLLQRTLKRADAVPGSAEILTVTNHALLSQTVTDYEVLPLSRTPHTLVLEPEPRDTAPAIAAATSYVVNTHGPDTILCVLPADQCICDQATLISDVQNAISLAQHQRIVTFGIKPTHPETGFGYIEANGERIVRFIEKPDLKTAESFLADGRYLWNSGMFCFQAGTMMSAMQKYCPCVLEPVRNSLQLARTGKRDGYKTIELDPVPFRKSNKISIDYAVMEKTSNGAVIVAGFGMTVFGNFTALAELTTADKGGNRIVGNVTSIDTQNSYIRAGHRMVATLGVEDLMVVETAEAVLVADRDRAQDVRILAENLQKKNGALHTQIRTVQRPWGTYTVLEEGDRFKIKRVEVKPGARLSLQMHHHRSEHWVIVEGAAKILNNDQELILTANQSTYIPSGVKHRLENAGKSPLVLIEVQSGDYLGEDDIVRFDDMYGRI